MLATLILAASIAPQAAPAPPTPGTQAQDPVQSLIQVEVDAEGLQRLLSLDMDVPHVHPGADHAQVIADAGELATLRQVGIQYRVLVDDLQAWYAERLDPSEQALSAGSPYGANLSPAFGQGEIGGYYSYDEVTSILDQISAANPSIVTQKVSLGSTIQGRQIWMVKVSDNPGVDENEPEVRYDSMHHAREPQGMQTNLFFLSYLVEEYGSDPMATYLVNEREIFFIPIVNPDGYVYNQQIAPNGGGLWRKNRRNNGNGTTGVDLNRNYPYQWGFDGVGSSGNGNSETYRGAMPASEPETQAMVSFIQSRSFKTALSIHTFSNLWISPWGYDELFPSNYSEFSEIGELATEENNYVHAPGWVTLYTANGVTNDYDLSAKGTLSWTPEIGSSADGFWPPQSRIVPLAEENLLAFQRTALAAGPWVRVESTELVPLGDGDAFPEAGEIVELIAGLRNSGLAPSGALSGTLTTMSPFATVTSGSATATALGNFSSANLSPNLAVQIAPGTPPGTVIELHLDVSDGVRSFDTFLDLEVGEVSVVAEYDFEAAGNQGWTVGNPNDASTGNWERVNPLGTSSAPEDDASDPGVRAWITGQGSVGGGLGEDDIDGGTTTLVSPILDATGLVSPRVNFARWYHNTGNGVVDDVFEVDFSSNGGATWVTAEVVGAGGLSGGWVEVSLNVEDFVPATNQLRVRFLASDLGSGSIVEAGIDDFSISGIDSSCPPPQEYCVTTPHSAGSGALISATGSQVVSENAFGLSVTGSVPNEFGIFFYGAQQANVAIGNGVNCVGGTLFRLSPVLADGTGGASFPLDLTNPPLPAAEITAGSTWNFSWWFRDPGVGAGFNFSNGVSVPFCN